MTKNVTTLYESQDIEKTKALAWLSYLWILFLIPMLVNKDSAYTKFHVNQGIVLFLTEVVGGIAIRVLGFVLGIIPFIGALLTALISIAFGICTLVFCILGIAHSLQGKAESLPIIGGIELYK